MAAKTSIEWTRSDTGEAGATWNCIRGCTRVSRGCGGPGKQGGCYAEKIAARFSDPGQPFHGFATRTNGWTGKLALIEDLLTLPLKWKHPRRIFVNSMSDMFHENLPDEAIDRVFAVMAMAPQHTYQILTKRPERMREYFAARAAGDPWAEAADYVADLRGMKDHPVVLEPKDIPLPGIWLGTSTEDQETFDERWPHLRDTPAAVRFISYEPALGPLDIGDAKPDWLICGGESGPNSRPFEIRWARSIIKQCKVSGVACFMKQVGSHPITDYPPGRRWRPADRKGGDPDAWPLDLRVREYPR